ncbi:MAG TPA: ParA family protein, partial [Blastocatellia bacterium]|nr:ParA family protein [Blastocatellia bacterium]
MKKAPFIFSVYSLKGGSAKTSTAVNLAASFAASGYKILYVDMDPQSHGAQRFGMSKQQIAERSIAQAMQKRAPFDSMVFHSKSDNINVIAGGSALRDLVRLHETDKHRAYLLAPVLKSDCLLKYDIALIDTDGKTGPLIESALAVSHGYIAPCPPEKDPINDLGETIHLANQMTDVINPGLDLLGVVITRYDSKLSVHKEYYRQLSEAAAQGNIRVF